MEVTVVSVDQIIPGNFGHVVKVLPPGTNLYGPEITDLLVDLAAQAAPGCSVEVVELGGNGRSRGVKLVAHGTGGTKTVGVAFQAFTV